MNEMVNGNNRREENPYDDDVEEREPIRPIMPREEEKLEAGNNLINAPKIFWLIILGLWFLVGVVVLYTMNIAIIGYIILFIVWLYFDFGIVSERENAISVCWGKMNALSSSGPVLVLRGIEKLLRYPTSSQQITFEKEAGIYTKTGPSEYDKKEILRSILLPVKVAVNFTWPTTYKKLLKAVKFAPPPDKKGLKELEDQLEELFLDIVRTVGGGYTYEQISQKRTVFTQRVADVINGKVNILEEEVEKQAQQLQEMIGLFQLENITVSLKHIEIPPELKKAMEARAAAFSLGEASKIAESSKRFGIAEGEAEIRRAIVSIFKQYGEDAVKVEALLTLRETAQSGKSTYMIMPQQVYDTLSKALGGSPGQALSGISEDSIKKIVESILQTRK